MVMAGDVFDKYLSEVNKAYLRGDATEHTHRPALKALIEALGEKVTATNEPKRRTDCGAPDILVSTRKRKLDFRIGYIECKDIGTDLKKEEKTEQIKKRYLPSLHNFILTDYLNFRWYTYEELRLTATLACEAEGGTFKATEGGKDEVKELLRGFLEHEPEKVASAKELAVRMGHTARMLRDVTKTIFEQEEKTGPLHVHLAAFRKVLLPGLSEDEFADMYAQAIGYGLFAAWCHVEGVSVFGKDKYGGFHGMDLKGEQLTREHAAYLLPKTNPFLRKVFGQIVGPDLDDRLVWIVDDLVELLREAKMESVLKGFGRKGGRSDPVVHFYETFLKEYDPELRELRGVYYTPDEVVSYIVRSVDWLLKENFGLKRGLADESKVTVDSRIRGNDKKEVHRVLILDPAVGTGTFLFEVIQQIHRRFRGQEGTWPGYVREHLLPRIFGFEFMMAPYAIAHTRLGLELADLGYDFDSDERLGIYLTNTLEEAQPISDNVFVQGLSEEATEADKVKKDLPIMVVLGNPPYSGHSANKGKWIARLIDDYKKIGDRKIRLGQGKWLQNDYVKFLRYAQHRISQTGCGIVGMITDHSYIDSGTFVGMRASLKMAFDQVYILDLQGNAKKNRNKPDVDHNVFDITQGVAIILAVKRGNEPAKGEIFVRQLRGIRKHKQKYLMNERVDTIKWEKGKCTSPYYLFVSSETSHLDEFDKMKSVVEVLPGEYKSENAKRVGTGFVTTHDEFAISFSKEEAIEKIVRLLRTETEREARSVFSLCSQEQWSYTRAREELSSGKYKKQVRDVAYRPFDYRFTIWNENVCVHRRLYVHRQLERSNRLLCVGQAGNVIGSDEWALVFVSKLPVDFNMFYRGGCALLPLYLYPELIEQNGLDVAYWPRGKEGRVPNLSRAFVAEFCGRVNLEFVSDGRGNVLDSRLRGNDKGTFGPEDVFDYIYGVLHSPEYRRRYAEFLKIDFPRVPWPKGRSIFKKVCAVGGQLVKLHLMEAEVLEDERRWPGFAVVGESLVEKGYPKYVAHAERAEKGRVYINKEQYFEGVRPEVWEFHIGGYQV
jgi:predicted helicase